MPDDAQAFSRPGRNNPHFVGRAITPGSEKAGPILAPDSGNQFSDRYSTWAMGHFWRISTRDYWRRWIVNLRRPGRMASSYDFRTRVGRLAPAATQEPADHEATEHETEAALKAAFWHGRPEGASDRVRWTSRGPETRLTS
jgi:hypothetical protein